MEHVGQLIHFTFNSVIDPLGGTKGDYSKYYNNNTNMSYLEKGGNYEYAVKRLSQWVGAVNESDVPYSNASTVYNNGLDENMHMVMMWRICRMLI